MTRIMLSDEQLRQIDQANGDLEFVNAKGEPVAVARRPIFTREEIEQAEKRANSGGPWYTTAEVLAHLRALAPE